MNTDQLAALQQFARTVRLGGYVVFPPSSMRDQLRKLGMIERWNPSLRATGRIKPWRITAAGYTALQMVSLDKVMRENDTVLRNIGDD